MKTKHAVALAMLAALSAPSWAVNKCTGPDGAVAYQEEPCEAGKGQALKLQPVPKTAPIDAAFANAIASGKIMIGMTADQVRRAWGTPTKVNVTAGSYGRHEQWVYDRGNFVSQYVYVENGIVASVQSPQ